MESSVVSLTVHLVASSNSLYQDTLRPVLNIADHSMAAYFIAPASFIPTTLHLARFGTRIVQLPYVLLHVLGDAPGSVSVEFS